MIRFRKCPSQHRPFLRLFWSLLLSPCCCVPSPEKLHQGYYHELLLKGYYHLPQFMPRCKDARRLNADPKNEPDFYSIGVLFPLKNPPPPPPPPPPPLPSPALVHGPSASNVITASIGNNNGIIAGTPAAIVPSLTAMWNQRFQEGLVAYPNKLTNKVDVPRGDQVSGPTTTAAVVAAGTNTDDVSSLVNPTAILASLLSSSPPHNQQTTSYDCTVPIGLQALLGNSFTMRQQQQQEQQRRQQLLLPLPSIPSTFQSNPQDIFALTLLSPSLGQLSSLLTAMTPATTTNNGHNTTASNVQQLYLLAEKQQQQQRQEEEDTNLIRVLSLLMSQQQPSQRQDGKNTEEANHAGNNNNLVALVAQHLARQQHQQQQQPRPPSGASAFF